MREWALDLHIHTLLSPCADDSMIPSVVLEYAKELGIDALAITDHNTSENVASFMEKGKELGVKIIPGMELQTQEDVHIICLFDTLRQTNLWQEIVYKKLPPLKNSKEYFGEQWIVNKDDELVRELDKLLLVGTSFTIEDAVEAVHELKGICIAAHVDKQAFSLWGHLGYIPPGLFLDGVEFTPFLPRNVKQLEQIKNEGYNYIVSSDAHHWDGIQAPQCYGYMEEINIEEIKKALRNEEGRYIRTLR
ncbi:MAG: PHP domain-containing protein [Clostridia bacterium]|nr:PHP domain-containing protein [Clostridia bacterium]MDD4047447.1 PHP domain-containing protein [Clostridia bacterium]